MRKQDMLWAAVEAQSEIILQALTYMRRDLGYLEQRTDDNKVREFYLYMIDVREKAADKQRESDA